MREMLEELRVDLGIPADETSVGADDVGLSTTLGRTSEAAPATSVWGTDLNATQPAVRRPPLPRGVTITATAEDVHAATVPRKGSPGLSDRGFDEPDSSNNLDKDEEEPAGVLAPPGDDKTVSQRSTRESESVVVSDLNDAHANYDDDEFENDF